MQPSLRHGNRLIWAAADVGSAAAEQTSTSALASAVGSICQQIRHASSTGGQPSHTGGAAASSSSSGTSAGDAPPGGGILRRLGTHRQSSLLSRHNTQLSSSLSQHQQQQQHQCRSLSDVATSEQETVSGAAQQILDSQRYQQQQQRQPHAPAARSDLEVDVLQAHSAEALAAVVDRYSSSPAAVPQPKEVLVALNKLSKLNKAHRTQLRLQIKALQQHSWRSLRPLDAEQQQQLQQLQEQHAQHQATVNAVLERLLGWLQTAAPSLHSEQWVQVLGCFGSLGVQQVPGGHAMLLVVLQHIIEGLPALQAKHLLYIATTLGQLQDAERGSSAHDDTSAGPELLNSADDTADAAGASSGPRHPQLQQQQAQEQVATADMCRLLVQELCGAAQRVVSLMDAGTAANFVAAMGRLGHYDWQTMRRVGAAAMQQSQSFTSAQAAKFLAGCTKLRHFDAELCARLAHATERDMASASGVQVAQIMWALAHQRFEQQGVFEAAAHQIPLKAQELQPLHVANLSWAFAVRKAYSPPLYDALAARMVQLLELDRGSSSDGSSDGSSSSGGNSLFFNHNDVVRPHHLSLVAWSFAKQGHKHVPMMLAIADRAAVSAGQMLPQNISHTAWAFGSLGVQHPAMFAALADEAKRARLEGYNNQNITDLALGFANAGHQDPELFALVAAVTSANLYELSPHSLSDLITAFAKARDPQAAQVLEAAAPAVAACVPRFSVAMLADMLCSYAEMGVKHEALLKGAAQDLPGRITALEQDTDSQAKIIWSMKQLGWRDAGLERVLSALVPNLADLLQA